jgi:hypothetical protein
MSIFLGCQHNKLRYYVYTVDEHSGHLNLRTFTNSKLLPARHLCSCPFLRRLFAWSPLSELTMYQSTISRGFLCGLSNVHLIHKQEPCNGRVLWQSPGLECRRCATNKRNPCYRRKRCDLIVNVRCKLMHYSVCILRSLRRRETRDRRCADSLVYSRVTISTAHMLDASSLKYTIYFCFLFWLGATVSLRSRRGLLIVYACLDWS